MRKSVVIVLVLVMLQLHAQNISEISYQTFVESVLKHNPLAKRADNELNYANLQLKAARGQYDPMLSGEYEQKQFNGNNYYTNLNSEIKQAVFTAQYLKFGYNYGNGMYMNPENNTPMPGQAYLGLELGLLQGMVIDKRRAEVLKSKAYLNYYEAEKFNQINHLLFESSQRYFDWLLNLKLLALNNYFMQLAKQRLTGIEALAAIGERAAVDTVEAAIFYQTRVLDLQSTKIENQKILNDVLAYRWYENKASAIDETIIGTDSLELYFFKAKNLLGNKLYQQIPVNPVVKKYQSLQHVLEIDNRLKKEMIKPVLNFKYNLLSNNAVSVYPSLSANNYKVGMQLLFPLLLRTPGNAYKMAKVNSQNNQFDIMNKSNELNFKINALRKNMGLLAEQLQTAEKSAMYNKMLVDAEKLKFTGGESTLFMMNTRESKWLESEIKLAEYKLKFIKNVLNLIYLHGDLNYVF